ncbi:MAG TPA: hypothetical protein VGV36_04680 [Solirubrobacteraceae bacterium]|nr:hypothetical protein [Solirubrobacteraceae bacterium]
MNDDRCELLCLDRPWAQCVRRSLLTDQQAEQPVARAAALGDPTRLKVASRPLS